MLISNGDKIALRSISGRYLGLAQNTTLVDSINTSISDLETFTVEEHGNNTIALKLQNGNYLSVKFNGDFKISLAVKPVQRPGIQEIFEVIETAEKKIALRSHYGILSPEATHWSISPIAMTTLDGFLYVIENERMWRVDPATGNPKELAAGRQWIVPPIAMTALGGFLYVIENERLWRVNPETGNPKELPAGRQWLVPPIAMTALDGFLYVIENERLWRVNPETGNPKELAAGRQWVVPPIAMTALDGFLYVIENERMWRVDPATGNPKELAAGRQWIVPPIAMTTLNGSIYVIENERMWRVDPATGNPKELAAGRQWIVPPIAITTLNEFFYVIENERTWKVIPETGRPEELRAGRQWVVPPAEPQSIDAFEVIRIINDAHRLYSLNGDKFSYVVNASDKDLFVKPGLSGDSVRIKPGERYDGPIDGLATTLSRDSKILKVVDVCQEITVRNEHITVTW